jgi:cystathionine beta-lyase
MSFPTFPLSTLRRRQGAKWQRYGAEVIPCWVADMDFPLAPPLRALLAGALEREELGYPFKGDGDAVLERFCQRMDERFDWHPRPDECCLLTDVVQGLYVAVSQFSEPGDGVVLQTPLYPPFFGAVLDNNREIIRNPLIQSQSGWHVDVDSLRQSVTSRTRILALCNPHNPSGRVFSRGELEALAELAMAHDLTVLCDEIHADLVYPGAQHIPFASLSPEVARRTVTFNSATKAFNIAGLRVAVAHFGCAGLKARFQGISPRVLGGPPAYAARATAVAWGECDDWREAALAYLQGNRDHVAHFVAEHLPGVRHITPQATYLAWLDFRDADLGEDPHAFLLREGRIALNPGPDFGVPEGTGCARLNFATDRAVLAEILQRMATALAGRIA